MSGYTIDNKDMANPNTNAELGAEAAAEVETPRTPRISIVEGLRKFIRELGSVIGLKKLAGSGSEEEQTNAQIFSLSRAARVAGETRGDSPDKLAAYQRGTEAVLKGDELPQAA